MKLLSGAELVDYIKVRQAKQVRGLRQAHHITPRLAIVQTIDDPVIAMYVKKLKQQYAADILIEADHYQVSSAELMPTIQRLANDELVHGIIIQLPLADAEQTVGALQSVPPKKDVDGLGSYEYFDPATATAINWLCAGYNIDLAHQDILIIGQGRLVGQPLTRMWNASGYRVTTADKTTDNLAQLCQQATLIVSSTGVPGLLTSNMIRPDTIVIDAGTVAESGVIHGDVSPAVYARHDLTITPRIGGVGPLTVAALFDNVIKSARRQADARLLN